MRAAVAREDLVELFEREFDRQPRNGRAQARVQLKRKDSSIASGSSVGSLTQRSRACGWSARFSASIIMKPPSDSTPAMISVVVVSSTSRSSSRSPSISDCAKLEIRSLRG